MLGRKILLKLLFGGVAWVVVLRGWWCAAVVRGYMQKKFMMIPVILKKLVSRKRILFYIPKIEEN